MITSGLHVINKTNAPQGGSVIINITDWDFKQNKEYSRANEQQTISNVYLYLAFNKLYGVTECCK